MQLTDALLDLCKSVSAPIIAIDGPAGAGKTTLAAYLQSVLNKSMTVHVVHMDDLYHGWNTPFDKEFTSRLTTITDAHRENRPSQVTRYDWKSASYLESMTIDSCDLLILEGVASSHSIISDTLTATIWVDTSEETGLERVLARDGAQYQVEMHLWLTLQKQHFKSQGSQKKADFELST